MENEEKERLSSYDRFLLENRVRINTYLNISLWCFIATGPAIALGIEIGFFTDISFTTCFIISIAMFVLSSIHFILLKKYPRSLVTSMFALLGLNLLLVYMTYSRVSICLTWFLVPLLSILLCLPWFYLLSVAVNYALMALAVWLISPYNCSFYGDKTTPVEYFLETFGGYTIETVIVGISGYALVSKASSLLKELTHKYREAMDREALIAQRMDILDSMAEIYDDVNLINFNHGTETSLRDENLTEHELDLVNQTHTQMNQKIRPFIMPDQTQDFLNFTNIKTVQLRLTNKKIISADFIHILKGWFRAQYITAEADQNGVPRIVIYTVRNIDEEKRREEHLIRISMTDELTRLYNRRCYEEDIAKYREEPLEDDFVLISIDVNGLKTANDNLGHAAGDELIKGAADCLASTVGNRGKAYRTGGDEFLVIIRTDKPDELCDKIRKKTAEWHGM